MYTEYLPSNVLPQFWSTNPSAEFFSVGFVFTNHFDCPEEEFPQICCFPSIFFRSPRTLHLSPEFGPNQALAKGGFRRESRIEVAEITNKKEISKRFISSPYSTLRTS
jgi:hypothetical protein